MQNIIGVQIPYLKKKIIYTDLQEMTEYWFSKIWQTNETTGEQEITSPYFHTDWRTKEDSEETLSAKEIKNIEFEISETFKKISNLEERIPQKYKRTKQITELLTIPVNGILTDETTPDGEKYNFNPKDFNRILFQTLFLSEKVQILLTIKFKSTYAKGKWDLVLTEGGAFGWVRNSDLVEVKDEEQYEECYITEPALEISRRGKDFGINSTEALQSPFGFTLGNKVSYRIDENNKYWILIPNRVNSEVEINPEFIQKQIETFKYDEFIKFPIKLLDSHYAWGGGTVYKSNGENLFGLTDCAGLIQAVMRIYGINLTNHVESIESVGEVLYEKIKNNGDKEMMNEKEIWVEIEKIMQSNFNGPIFLTKEGKGHVAIALPKTREIIHSHWHPRGNFTKSIKEVGMIDKVKKTNLNQIDPTLFPNLDSGYPMKIETIWGIRI